jgi:hypothetical protein
MVRINCRIIKFAAAFLILSVFAGCSKENSTKDFDLQEFENTIKDRGYTYEIQDAEKDFLPATRKRMIINEIALDVYLFSSNKKMEKEAGYIDNGPSG